MQVRTKQFVDYGRVRDRQTVPRSGNHAPCGVWNFVRQTTSRSRRRDQIVASADHERRGLTQMAQSSCGFGTAQCAELCRSHGRKIGQIMAEQLPQPIGQLIELGASELLIGREQQLEKATAARSAEADPRLDTGRHHPQAEGATSRPRANVQSTLRLRTRWGALAARTAETSPPKE